MGDRVGGEEIKGEIEMEGNRKTCGDKNTGSNGDRDEDVKAKERW